MLNRKSARGAAVAPDDERHQALEQIHAAHCLLEVRCEGDARAAQSAIIELVPQRGYFVLDAFTPPLDPQRLAASPQIQVRARLDGRDIRFATRLLKQGGKRGAPYYMAAYPEHVDNPQRRREFRVNVPLDKGAQVVLHGAGGVQARGELRDLSPSGFSAHLDAAECERVGLDNGWRGTCSLNIDSSAALTGAVEVCHVKPATGPLPARVGVCFVDLDARSERRIERYVAELDRERARLR